MRTPTAADISRIYNDIATYYDLISQDWESSMSRRGTAIDQLIRRELGSELQPPAITVVDASAGIGTQALALALKGYRVNARDILPDAIARLQREAAQRGLDIPFAVADMRALRSSVSESFRVVLSFGNSLPHATMVIEEERVDDWRKVVRMTQRAFLERTNPTGRRPRGVWQSAEADTCALDRQSKDMPKSPPGQTAGEGVPEAGTDAKRDLAQLRRYGRRRISTQ